MGGSTFRQYLQGPAKARQPLLRSSEASGFEITPLGQLVVAGKQDHVRLNGINRCLGGVQLRNGAPVWRWHEANQTIRAI